MDENQRDRFREALDEKQLRDEERARTAAGEPGAEAHEEQPAERNRPEGTRSVRAKSSGHGKKTAAKWNQ